MGIGWFALLTLCILSALLFMPLKAYIYVLCGHFFGLAKFELCKFLKAFRMRLNRMLREALVSNDSKHICGKYPYIFVVNKIVESMDTLKSIWIYIPSVDQNMPQFNSMNKLVRMTSFFTEFQSFSIFDRNSNEIEIKRNETFWFFQCSCVS